MNKTNKINIHSSGNSIRAKHHMKSQSKYILGIAVLVCLLIQACNKSQAPQNQVKVRISTSPTCLNPLLKSTIPDNTIQEQLFQSILSLDPETMKLVPVLVDEMPKRSADAHQYTFKLREEANWDNGSPITGYDFLFTLKAIKNPFSHFPQMRAHIPKFSSVKVNPENPKEFVVTLTSPSIYDLPDIGMISILPAHHYDPKGLLEPFKIEELEAISLSLDENGAPLPNNVISKAELEQLRQFAENFSGPKYKKEPQYINGSGPYKITQWDEGQRVVIERKKNWWADKLKNKNKVLLAYPEKIIFKVYQDPNTAIIALKNQELDLMDYVPARDFNEDEILKQQYHHLTTEIPGCFFTILNNKPPIERVPYFTDKRVRKAFAHVFNTDFFIKNLYDGLGSPVVTPITPMFTDIVHKKLPPIPFDIEKAKKLLEEAGWKDLDGDGIREKIIGGKKVAFTPTILLNSNANKIFNLLREDAKKAGMDIRLDIIPFNILLEKVRAHQFDMAFMGTSYGPLTPDLSQGWTTDSWTTGVNYSGFGNAQTDSIIYAIPLEFDFEKRKKLYYKIQEIIYEEQPVTFFKTVGVRIVVHKRFERPVTCTFRPGYRLNLLRIKEQSE